MHNHIGSDMHFDIEERLFHFKQPAGTSRGVYTTRRSWFVTLTDNEGFSGMGECAPLPSLSCDDIPDYADVLSDFAERLCTEGELSSELCRYPSMLFGLETALLSLRRRSNSLSDTPFAQGKEGIPINGLVWMGTYDEMLPRIEEKLSRGFRCVKIKIGAIDFDDELQLLRHIRRRFSAETVELRVDANGAFLPGDAIRKMSELSRFGIHSIEQPIRQGQWEAMARLCSETPLPIALDEELIGIGSTEEKVRLLDTIRPHFLVLKPSLHGGMSGTREWVSLASQGGRNIGTWITSALESNVGLNAIAHLCADLYGPRVSFPQGLGTGQLFEDNIPMPLEIRGDEMWINDQQ